jgi:hypothetical protein
MDPFTDVVLEWGLFELGGLLVAPSALDLLHCRFDTSIPPL